MPTYRQEYQYSPPWWGVGVGPHEKLCISLNFDDFID